MHNMKSSSYVYLDYAASAPQRRISLQTQEAYEESAYAGANPNSLHTPGRLAYAALERSRREIASCFTTALDPYEVHFTSGGTESNNMALCGIAPAYRLRQPHRTKIVVSAIEHDSCLEPLGRLKEQGFEVVYVRPSSTGEITCEQLRSVLDEHVALTCIMYANNETGVIQPIRELARCAHEVGSYVMSDAVQAFGRIPCDLEEIDACSIAAHKIGGPVGIGALILKRNTPFVPLTFGGGQEGGARPGTQAVCLCEAFAQTACECIQHIKQRRSTVAARAHMLEQMLCASDRITPTTPLSFADKRLPGIVSVLAKDCDAQAILLQLDSKGFGISSGSACASDSARASHVLRAQGICERDALGALRISFDERVDEDTLKRFANTLLSIVTTSQVAL